MGHNKKAIICRNHNVSSEFQKLMRTVIPQYQIVSIYLITFWEVIIFQTKHDYMLSSVIKVWWGYLTTLTSPLLHFECN